MTADHKPIYGYSQYPHMGFLLRNNPTMDISKIIGANISALMSGPDGLNTSKKLAAKSGVGFGTVQRARAGDANITVEKLTLIAKAFKRHPAELMIECKSTLSPPATADYSTATDGQATRLDANEPPPKADIIDLPPPLLSELIGIAKRIDDAGLHRLIGQAQQLAEHFPRANKGNAAN